MLRLHAQLIVAPSRSRSLFHVVCSSSSAPSRIHLYHRGVSFIFAPLHTSSSLRRCTLIFIIAPSYAQKCVPVSRDSILKQKTFSLLHGTLYSPNLTFTDIAFIFLLSTSCRDNKSAPAVRPSSLSCRSSAHLHCCAHHKLIFIVAPVARPSSLLRPSRTHLHCRAGPSSLLRPSCTHLHRRAGRAPIFIVAPVTCPSSSSRQPILIVVPIAHPSSLLRPLRAHLHCCAGPPSLLRRQDRALCLLSRRRGRTLSLLPRLCCRAFIYRCAINFAHSDSNRAVEVARSVHCCAFEVARSVSSRAFTLRSQLIFSLLRLRSQDYCCAVKVVCSVDCHAPTFIIAPIAQLSSSSRPSRVHLNHCAVALIVPPIE